MSAGGPPAAAESVSPQARAPAQGSAHPGPASLPRFRVVPVPRPAVKWLEERVGVELSSSARAIAAVNAAGQVRGMVAYDGWTDSSAQVHVAADAPAAWRALVRPMFQYPFLQGGRTVLIALVRASNKRSLRLAMGLGAEVVCRIRDAAAVGEDLVVVQMRREGCHWIRKEESDGLRRASG